MSKEVYLIVGLGNPGAEYAHTRHNAGFEVMALLEKHFGVTLGRKMLQGLLCEITEGERKIVLCEPQTFMNNSGDCVSALLRWYHADLDHLLVIYDDIDLPPGRVRVRGGGGPGTHNGMRSIVDALGEQKFPRIRVGTGDRPAGEDLIGWVLGRPRTAEEKETMEKAFALAAECALDWLEHGTEHAVRTCEEKQKPPRESKPEHGTGRRTDTGASGEKKQPARTEERNCTESDK